ncbi:hypothetical protein D779_3199 [Imhoffiella purpurea]|uniref:DUF4124 domain-containing protein n=2 Tax=Imhoffiella purpurea TaxID=1249627 RepID=W9VCX9_9GAMM|nr:hypothetical protein D779_3199 [Imhoffiella purpurea]
MRHPDPSAPRLMAIGILILAGNAQAELYKCLGPDGRTTYQQTACDAASHTTDLELDAHPASGSGKDQDYSIEKQLEAMRDGRARRAKARAQTRPNTQTARSARTGNPGFDAAKCARHRSETAKWRQKAMNAYRTRSDKEYNDNRLAYHEALMERYCAE